MSFFGKVAYFVLTIANSALLLFLIWYSFDVYIAGGLAALWYLLRLCFLIFIVLMLYIILQGFVYRISFYIAIKENNYYNKLYLGDNEIE